jgi:hypothetical protein
VFDDAAWSGAQRGDMRPMAGADFNPINMFGQIGFELRAFPRHGGRITTLVVFSRADLERLALAAFQALGLEAVTFGPMPDGKPLGGFLEIGDCATGEGTYPWEAAVSLRWAAMVWCMRKLSAASRPCRRSTIKGTRSSLMNQRKRIWPM